MCITAILRKICRNSNAPKVAQRLEKSDFNRVCRWPRREGSQILREDFER
jgi:hypothetical protein